MSARDPRRHEDPHEQLEQAGKRSSAMKAIVSIIVAVFLAGAAVASWLNLFETRTHADQTAAAIRGEVAQSKLDCDKRLRSLEIWQGKYEERSNWMVGALDKIGRKLDAKLPPPPPPPLEDLKK